MNEQNSSSNNFFVLYNFYSSFSLAKNMFHVVLQLISYNSHLLIILATKLILNRFFSSFIGHFSRRFTCTHVLRGVRVHLSGGLHAISNIYIISLIIDFICPLKRSDFRLSLQRCSHSNGVQYSIPSDPRTYTRGDNHERFSSLSMCEKCGNL